MNSSAFFPSYISHSIALQNIAAAAAVLNSLFLLIQVVAFADRKRGWINRPWFIYGPMLCYAAATLNRAVAYFDRSDPHISDSGALAILLFFVWQLIAVVHITVSSVKAREAAIRQRLISDSPAWSENPPPVYTIGHDA